MIVILQSLQLFRWQNCDAGEICFYEKRGREKITSYTKSQGNKNRSAVSLWQNDFTEKDDFLTMLPKAVHFIQKSFL